LPTPLASARIPPVASGKGTVLKTIDGLLKSWALEGRGYFDGNDMTALPGAEMTRRGIASMPQKKNVSVEFTVGENLLTSAAIYPKVAASSKNMS